MNLFLKRSFCSLSQAKTNTQHFLPSQLLDQLSDHKLLTLHCIRHAESEFNNHPSVKGKIDGFFPLVTKLDASLSNTGIEQSKILGQKIEKLNNEPITNNNIKFNNSINNSQLIITSPLSRAIETGLGAFDINKYQFEINSNITEQVENTTDLGQTHDIKISSNFKNCIIRNIKKKMEKKKTTTRFSQIYAFSFFHFFKFFFF
jgi:bisphosphoglycerate-dependent phosphoglycerate mutase